MATLTPQQQRMLLIILVVNLTVILVAVVSYLAIMNKLQETTTESLFKAIFELLLRLVTVLLTG